MADNVALKDANSATFTSRSKDLGGGLQLPMSNLADAAGASLVGQKAKAASLPVALASDDDLLALIGAAVASPAANTVQDRLKALLTGIVLAAGESHVGEIGASIAIATATFNRPADTNAYVAGDLVGGTTTAGATGNVMALTAARANDKSGSVRRVRLKTNDTAFLGAAMRVHLWRDQPTLTIGDNGVFAAGATESNYLGYADVVLAGNFSDAVKGFGVPAIGAEFNFIPSSGTRLIYAALETRTAVTPGSGKTWTLDAEVHQN